MTADEALQALSGIYNMARLAPLGAVDHENCLAAVVELKEFIEQTTLPDPDGD